LWSTKLLPLHYANLEWITNEDFFVNLKNHRSFYDVKAIWTQIDRELIEKQLQNKENEFQLTQMEAACSLVQSTTTILQTTVKGIGTTVRFISRDFPPLINYHVTGMNKIILLSFFLPLHFADPFHSFTVESVTSTPYSLFNRL